MSVKLTQRGNTLFMAFTFLDEDDAVASVDSATVQLTYPGVNDFETALVTLTEDGDAWEGTFDTNKVSVRGNKQGWIDYAAKAIAGSFLYVQTGSHRIIGNRASMDLDTLDTAGTASSSARGYTSGSDYGS